MLKVPSWLNLLSSIYWTLPPSWIIKFPCISMPYMNVNIQNDQMNAHLHNIKSSDFNSDRLHNIMLLTDASAVINIVE